MEKEMINLKQQLEAVGDRLALEFCGVKEEGLNNLGEMKYSSQQLQNLEFRHIKQPTYKAGFNAAIPIIMELAEALEFCLNNYLDKPLEKAVPDGVLTTGRIEAKKTLNSLKKFVEVTNDNQ